MWTNLLNERSKNIHSRLQNLEDRVKQLEKSFEEARVAIPKDIEERAEKLTIQLNDFQDSFDDEQKRRIERENAIAADLTQFTAKTKSDFEEEKVFFWGRDEQFTPLTSLDAMLCKSLLFVPASPSPLIRCCSFWLSRTTERSGGKICHFA